MRNLIFIFLVCYSFMSCQEIAVDSVAPISEPRVSAGADIDPNTNAPSPDGNIPGNWSLHWSDEFNNFDNDKWEKCISTKSRSVHPSSDRDPNVDWWGWTADNAWVNNGKLWLRSHKVSANRFECGAVWTKNKFDTKFGYFEAKIKIQDPKYGSHTAFWLQGENQGNLDQSGADGAEIDIFESVYKNSITKSVVHIDGYNSATKRAKTIKYNTHDMQDGQWHVYGLMWEPGLLKVYLDGVHKTTYRGAFVPLVEEFLWLSVGASFDYKNSISGSANGTNSGADGFTTQRTVGSKQSSQVAWVRVWKTSEKAYYRFKNRETGKWFKTYGITDNSDVKQCPTNQTGDWTTWEIVPTENGYFHFANENSGKYIRPINASDNSILQLKPTTNSGAWTQWKFLFLDDKTDQGDFYYLVNRETGKYFRPSSTSSTAPLILKPASSNGKWTQWQAIE